MCKLLLVSLFLFTINGLAQNYAFTDEKVINYPEFKTLNHLGIRISNDFNTDSQRVKAAFIWLTHNISYKDKSKSEIFKPKEQLIYYSEYGKEYLLRKKHLERIEKAFVKKRGVCIDYSLLLHELCGFFDLESKIIYGIAKNDIKNVKGERLYKNHTWNAVKIDGKWKLMDATWASAFIDITSNSSHERYLNHYFFTKPSELIKHHFPTDQKWQLVNNPIDIETFFNAPIFFPGYFQKDIKLSTITKGIITLSSKNNEHFLLFDKLPSNHTMYYSVNGTLKTIKIRLKKNRTYNSYVSILKLKKSINHNDFLTIFLEDDPILSFKIQNEK